MRKRDALKLHNRDEIQVRNLYCDGKNPNKWLVGYVLGSPREAHGRVIVPVDTKENGFQQLDHTDIR